MQAKSTLIVLQATQWIAIWSTVIAGLTVTAFAQGQEGAADPLVKMVERSDLTALRARLSSGANPNETDNRVVIGWTPLMEAAFSGNVAAARLLLESGAAIDAKTQSGKTAFDIAVAGGKTQVAELLRRGGARGGEDPFLKRLKACLSPAQLASVEAREARAVEPLVACLKNRDENVRQSAADALGRFHDARAVEPLLASLKDQDKQVRDQAAKALGNLGDARAVEPLIAYLQNENRHVRESAADALGNLGDARALEPLIASLKDQDKQVRESAVKALGNLGDARAIEPLIARLNDQDIGIQNLASVALDKLGKTAKETQRERLEREAALQTYFAKKRRESEEGSKALVNRALSNAGLSSGTTDSREIDCGNANLKVCAAGTVVTESRAPSEGDRKRLAQIIASLPPSRDKSAIYWLVEMAPGVFRLKETINCQPGRGAFLAEINVPCGSVFVNRENQIGGTIVTLP